MRKKLIVFLLLAWQSQSFAMSLQEFLGTVEKKNKSVQSLDVSSQVSDLNRLADDMSFVPTFTAGASYLSDRSPTNEFVTFGADESKVTNYNLGLSQNFSSGTAVALTAVASQIDNPGLNGNPLFNGLSDFSQGSLGVSFTQSLWKNAFGRGTRLLWKSQDASTLAEKGNFDLQKKTLMVSAEGAYWDYIYAKENLDISRASLQRSQKIAAWTKRRTADGISDLADLLQAQALVSQRETEVIAAEDDFAAAKKSIRDYMELQPSDPVPELTGDISEARSLNSMVNGNKNKVIYLEAYLASLQAKARTYEARSIEDSYRPDLVLQGSYNTNSKENNIAQATRTWTETNTPTAKVGINFTYLFDTDVKSSAQNAARKTALAAQLTSERKMLESESAWIELNRRYSEMSKKIQSATLTSKLQADRAKAQADLFNKGRSITSNVVQAEEDAASAALSLTKLKAEQRKMEAQGHLYIAVED